MTDFLPAAGWIVALVLAGLWWLDRRWQATAAAQLRRMLADAERELHAALTRAGHYESEYRALRRMIVRD